MVPPWTPAPDPESAAPAPDVDNDGADDGRPSPTDEPPALEPVPLAPPARFRDARRMLGEFAQSGSGREMRRSIGHYVRSGYGGAGTAARRLAGTATSAAALGRTLAGLAAGQPADPTNPLERNLLAGRTTGEVMDAVVEAVRPVDGTQDAEAERAAVRDSLSELLTTFPDADLLSLDADQRAFAIERFAAISVFRRFELDLGKTILEKASNAAAALARLKEIREYIKQSVSAAFRRIGDAGHPLTGGRIGQVVQRALRETLEVFESYAE